MRPKKQHTVRRYSLWLVLLFLVYAFLLHGCDNRSDTQQDSAGTCSISFQVLWERPPADLSINRALNADCEEVDHLVATVYNQNNEVLKEGGPWGCSEGSGTLSDVPAGTRGWVEVYLMDAEGMILYKGISMEIDLIPGQTINAGTIEANSFVPAPIAPLANAVVINGNVTFQWQTLTDVTQYVLQATNTISGQQFLYETSSLSCQTHDLTSPLTSYRWRIRAIDAGGNEGAWSDEISFTTDNNYIPSATISSPATNSWLFGNIYFGGYGIDMDEATSFDYSPVWTSSIDGVIGTSDYFYKGDLSVGAHTITLTVTDRVGAVASASINITVASEWVATSSNNWSEGDCNSVPVTAPCIITYNPVANVYTMTLGNDWGCVPEGVCTFQGTLVEGTYSFSNSVPVDGGSVTNTISFSPEGQSYTGSGTSESSNCYWGFDFTLTHN